MVKVIAVTVCRNEERTIRDCVLAVKNQTYPLYYVVVDDNSTDRTPEILDECGVSHVRLGNLETRLTGFRLPYGLVTGVRFAEKRCADWDYLFKIDADVVVPSDYVECMVREMEKFPGVGIASGTPAVRTRDGYVFQKMDRDHADDGARVYRRACWDSLKVYGMIGYDSYLLFEARRLGWRTTNFRVPYEEKRRWGRRSLSWWIGRGASRFVLGYPFLYVFLVAGSRLKQSPPVLGSLAMLVAYVFRHLTPWHRVFTGEYYRYVKDYVLNQMVRKVWTVFKQSGIV